VVLWCVKDHFFRARGEIKINQMKKKKKRRRTKETKVYINTRVRWWWAVCVCSRYSVYSPPPPRACLPPTGSFGPLNNRPLPVAVRSCPDAGIRNKQKRERTNKQTPTALCFFFPPLLSNASHLTARATCVWVFVLCYAWKIGGNWFGWTNTTSARVERRAWFSRSVISIFRFFLS